MIDNRKARRALGASCCATILAFVMGACGDDGGDPAAAPRSESSSSASSQPEVPSIVGEWSRTTTCADRVNALRDAGMAKYAARSVAGDGFIPGVSDVSELEDSKRPCLGAEAHVHSHFFTADGMFGSRDQYGAQVDDGSYELPSPGVLVIGTDEGPVRFDYAVTDGTLTMTPARLPACARHGCFLAEWEVAVTYLGLPWTKVDAQ